MPRFSRHAVCSPLTAASAAGLAVLRDGGNAVDAALATNLVLAVAYPHMCGVGGDLLAMVWHAGTLTGLISAGALPAAARLPEDGVVPVRGPGSATVPGAAAGWTALAARWATRPLADLAAPAIRLARDGVERSQGLARMTGWMRDALAADPEAGRIFLADGPLVQPELAAVLADLEGFYTGAVAERAPAPFAPEDFAAHRAHWVEVERAPFPGLPGVEVCELPPPSRGHLALAALARLESLAGLTARDAELHRRLVRALDPVVHPGDTIYLCAVDRDGTAVSLSQSLSHPFGSCVVVPGTGVLLHNRGAYHGPGTYRGGARPVHTLAPAMVLAGGRPRIVLGTMGGDAQVQIHLQLLAHLLLDGTPAAQAVAAPRWLFDRTTLWAEPGLPPLAPLPRDLAVRSLELSDMAGHAHAIVVDAHGLDAGCDPRADGVALGD